MAVAAVYGQNHITGRFTAATNFTLEDVEDMILAIIERIGTRFSHVDRVEVKVDGKWTHVRFYFWNEFWDKWSLEGGWDILEYEI